MVNEFRHPDLHEQKIAKILNTFMRRNISKQIYKIHTVVMDRNLEEGGRVLVMSRSPRVMVKEQWIT